MNVCVERCPQLFAVQVNVNWSRGSASLVVTLALGGAAEVEERTRRTGIMRRIVGRGCKEKIGEDRESEGTRRWRR